MPQTKLKAKNKEHAVPDIKLLKSKPKCFIYDLKFLVVWMKYKDKKEKKDSEISWRPTYTLIVGEQQVDQPA